MSATPDLTHRLSSRYNGGLRVTLCTCGQWEHDPKSWDGPMVQFAAHVATATERAVRERIARDIEADRPEMGRDINVTPYREGRHDGMTTAARIARGGAA